MIAAMVLAAPARAQNPGQEGAGEYSSYQGQNVASVELAGRPEIEPGRFARLFALRKGQPFDVGRAQQTLEALRKTGLFARVEMMLRPELNGVRVIFLAEPAVYFGIFAFPGAGRFSYTRLLQVAQYSPQEPYSTEDIERAEVSLRTFFQRNGYFQPFINPRVQLLKPQGLANLYLTVGLGRKARFGDVVISGTTEAEAQELRQSLQTFFARVEGHAIRPGSKYSLTAVEKATGALESHLTGKGHLGARVRLIGAQYRPTTNRADVRYDVTTGPVYKVEVMGAHLWPWTKKGMLPVYQQVGVDQEIIDEGRVNLTNYFNKKGYFGVKVTSKVVAHGGVRRIEYTVTKGPRHEVEGVKVQGNHALSSTTLLESVTVKKAGWWLFSHGEYSPRLVRESVNNLIAVYQAEGFNHVQVTPRMRQNGGDLTVTFVVDEGPRDRVESLTLEGNEHVKRAELLKAGVISTAGKPYSAAHVDQDRKKIVALYLGRGYLNASLRATAQRVKGERHRFLLTYHITEGPRVVVSRIETVGREATQRGLIERDVAELKVGGPLSERLMLEAENNLYDHGIFSWAEVDPRRPITTQREEAAVVKMHEAKRNELTWGLGFEEVTRGGTIPGGTVALPNLPPVGLPSNFTTNQQTLWGPRGSIQYRRNNVNGKGGTLSTSFLAGRLIQRGDVVFHNPNFRWTKWTEELSAKAENNTENPIYYSKQASAGLRFSRPWASSRTTHIYLSYEFSETNISHLLIPDLLQPGDEHVRLSTLAASITHDTRDDPINAHRGNFESLEFDINPGILGSSVDFVRGTGQWEVFRPVGEGIVWANSLRIGVVQPYAGSHVPLSEEYFSGGASTLRGFPLNGAGPQRTVAACSDPANPATCSPIQVPVGGDALLILNSEFRIPLSFIEKNLGVVGFYDGGNVFAKVGFSNLHANYTNTIGFGLRYDTPIGPVRFDIGHNLNPPAGGQATQYFFTVGQAF